MSDISGGLVAPGMECSHFMHNNHMYIHVVLACTSSINKTDYHTCTLSAAHHKPTYVQTRQVHTQAISFITFAFLCVKDSIKFAMNIG